MIFLNINFLHFELRIINKIYFIIGKNDDANSGGKINALLLPNTVK